MIASFIIRRTYVVIGEAELRPRQPEPPYRTGSATLVFYRAAREGIGHPGDVVELLNAEGIQTGTLRARNPITHDQWWIPLTALAAAAVPPCTGRSIQDTVPNGRRPRITVVTR